MTVDRAIEVLKQCIGDCGDCITRAERDEAIALAIKGLLVLRSANSLFVGSDALVVTKEREVEPVSDSETIGERIKSARKAVGLRQEALASMIGVCRTTVSKYETGDLELSVKHICKIADTLGVSTEWLLGGARE